MLIRSRRSVEWRQLRSMILGGVLSTERLKPCSLFFYCSIDDCHISYWSPVAQLERAEAVQLLLAVNFLGPEAQTLKWESDTTERHWLAEQNSLGEKYVNSIIAVRSVLVLILKSPAALNLSAWLKPSMQTHQPVGLYFWRALMVYLRSPTLLRNLGASKHHCTTVDLCGILRLDTCLLASFPGQTWVSQYQKG